MEELGCILRGKRLFRVRSRRAERAEEFIFSSSLSTILSCLGGNCKDAGILKAHCGVD